MRLAKPCADEVERGRGVNLHRFEQFRVQTWPTGHPAAGRAVGWWSVTQSSRSFGVLVGGNQRLTRQCSQLNRGVGVRLRTRQHGAKNGAFEATRMAHKEGGVGPSHTSLQRPRRTSRRGGG